MMCICGHPEENHDRGWGYCDGHDSNGDPCKCVMFEEYDPETDDEESPDDGFPFQAYDDLNRKLRAEACKVFGVPKELLET